MIAIDYQIIPIGELVLNEGETARRLHVARGFEMDEIDSCLAELKAVTNIKFSSVRVPVNYPGDDRLNCGFGEFKSATLIKNLQGCKEAFVFAVTLGLGVDRMLTQLSLVSPSKHFICDALASSMAEAAAEKAEEIIKGNLDCRPRFSPGFGDLSLEVQPRILELLNAQRLLGITTNKTFLMSPGKSVTAIVGIKNE